MIPLAIQHLYHSGYCVDLSFTGDEDASDFECDLPRLFDEADSDGTWELPSLAASNCAEEYEAIRNAIGSSAEVFERSLCQPIRQPNHSPGQPKRSTKSLPATFSYRESRRGHPLRQPIKRQPNPPLRQPRKSTRILPAACSTKDGRRRHKRKLHKA
jgi:hypothetical protein